MILIFYITHKVISLHGENQIGSRNNITPVRSHGWNNFDRMLMQGGLVASKELVLSLMFTYVWCLAITTGGDFIVSGSHDRSIRHWDRTKSHFSLREEKEKRLEEMFESDLDNAIENRYAPKEEPPEEGAVALTGKKTQETLTRAI
ncbi:hypothetical protein Patl1_35976 [Pistacia atlantica]|nr:hypothetical protein Patl1_35976 [Pistacia atlantica]